MTSCQFNAVSYGAGDFVVASATAGHATPENSNVTDAKIYTYYAQCFDTATPPNVVAWEAGSGAYIVSTHTLKRTTITANSNGDLLPVNFPTSPVVDVYSSSSGLLESLPAVAGNVIINGDFRINQRGYAGSVALTAGTYGHDRWKAGSGGGVYAFTQLPSSTQITINGSNTLIQVIEDKNVVGGTYVLSWTGTCKARAGINTATPAGAYASSPVMITGQTAGTTMSVEFGNDVASGTLGKVKLESGTVSTPFVPQDVQKLNSECQRYYHAIRNNGVGICLMSVYNSTLAIAGMIAFPVKMRTAPTQSISAAGDFNVLIPGGSTTACTSVTSNATTDLYADVRAGVASGLTTGQAVQFSGANSSSRLSFDAEL